MAQSLYQQLTAAAVALGIDMKAAESDAPAIEKPSARAQRRANKDAALNELRPAAKPVVAPAKPAPIAHVVPDMSLDEVLSFVVELPKFDLPTVNVCLGEMQADFFRRIGQANVALIRQSNQIRKEMAGYLAEYKALVQEAQVAQFWGQNQRAQDLRNAAAKREAARDALKPHLTRVMDAFFNASRIMGERIAMLDDNMAAYLAGQREIERQAREAQVKEMERQLAEQAQRAAEKAAEKAAAKAKAEEAADLAARMMAPKDADDAPAQEAEPVAEKKLSKLEMLMQAAIEAEDAMRSANDLVKEAEAQFYGRAIDQREDAALASYRKQAKEAEVAYEKALKAFNSAEKNAQARAAAKAAKRQA